jgi:hypothetical protein
MPIGARRDQRRATCWISRAGERSADEPAHRSTRAGRGPAADRRELFANPGRTQDMSSPNDPDLDPASAAELVARLIDAIDASDHDFRELLLSDLFAAAWGSALAQRQ